MIWKPYKVFLKEFYERPIWSNGVAELAAKDKGLKIQE